ncbi:PopZ family protein [Ancylobacter oerskovii]|uniref:PopZ family protein n=1 Tax=Ancylobacter oerskovii TaxID=459519 RepID=A0ABW4Z3Q2_9HYPH|nr:DUF2497 domain-containing protein [Ancylobacter oerskovii]MBS7546291.1 DUF2497 domain-containing protein [Ancylobacter oerskovii]
MEEILASIRRIISDDVAGEGEAAQSAGLVELVEVAPVGEDVASSAEPSAETVAGEPEELAAEPAVAVAAVAVPQHEAEIADATAPRPHPLPPTAAAAARTEATPIERAVHAELDGLAGSLHAQVMAAVTRSVESLAPKAFPETADMQVQAKPAVVSSRLNSTLAERRTSEDAEAPRGETRSLLARAEAEGRPNRLVSGAAGESVASSFGALARTVASNTRSMEDVVTDALRPMLRSWLDENLPELVERLVRAEIERVARHGQ